MKRFILYVFLVIVALGFSANDVLAQNPKQTKKQKMKKEKKKDAYTPVFKQFDTDGDGVPDERDECGHTPKGEKVTPFGCPIDTDFDGVYDYEDKCVNEKGFRENFGCPWGDRDKDGIMDNDDKCPDQPGVVKFKGCADTDNDGFMDNDDKCPTEPGVEKYQGCPPPFIDTDKDGISDYDDLCVTVPGVKKNKGCPELKKEDMEALDAAFKNLLFETNKDVIMESSFHSLDKLSKVMRNNPKYKLHLEGHTDNVGDDAKNMDLSKRRAASVKKYLVEKGVKEHHITNDGFGETKPVASNDDEEGRKQNRRVDMTIIPY